MFRQLDAALRVVEGEWHSIQCNDLKLHSVDLQVCVQIRRGIDDAPG